MNEFWLRVLVGAVFFLPGLVHARERPPLEQLVARSELIVKCKIEVRDDTIYYRVVETWKGEYFPEAFYDRPAEGYLYPVNGRHFKVSSSPIAAPVDGREVIFFFNRYDPPYGLDGKFVKHTDWLVVADGKVRYAVSRLSGHEVERIIYPLEDFKNAVLAATDR